MLYHMTVIRLKPMDYQFGYRFEPSCNLVIPHRQDTILQVCIISFRNSWCLQMIGTFHQQLCTVSEELLENLLILEFLITAILSSFIDIKKSVKVRRMDYLRF